MEAVQPGLDDISSWKEEQRAALKASPYFLLALAGVKLNTAVLCGSPRGGGTCQVFLLAPRLPACSTGSQKKSNWSAISQRQRVCPITSQASLFQTFPIGSWNKSSLFGKHSIWRFKWIELRSYLRSWAALQCRSVVTCATKQKLVTNYASFSLACFPSSFLSLPLSPSRSVFALFQKSAFLFMVFSSSESPLCICVCVCVCLSDPTSCFITVGAPWRLPLSVTPFAFSPCLV